MVYSKGWANMCPPGCICPSLPYSSRGVLRSMLFLIYVNGLPDFVSTKVKLFADDTKLYREIKNLQDKDVLQNDLNNLMKWSRIWQLFNESKFRVLHLGKNSPNHKYKLLNNKNEVELIEVTEEKIWDSSLTTNLILSNIHLNVSPRLTKELVLYGAVFNSWTTIHFCYCISP